VGGAGVQAPAHRCVEAGSPRAGAPILVVYGPTGGDSVASGDGRQGAHHRGFRSPPLALQTQHCGASRACSASYHNSVSRRYLGRFLLITYTDPVVFPGVSKSTSGASFNRDESNHFEMSRS
jgi:hypothetical protein